MTDVNVAKAINEQINAELYSAYLYLAMSSKATEMGLAGVANWLFVQYQEETAHAQIFYKYLTRVAAPVELAAIAQPPREFGSALEIFEGVLEHERKVTALIHNLVALARRNNDFAAENMLQWFVNEQVEEEENANDILSQLKLAGSGSGLFLIDRELGARTYVPPSPLVNAE